MFGTPERYAIFDKDESSQVPIWNVFDNKVNSTEGVTDTWE